MIQPKFSVKAAVICAVAITALALAAVASGTTVQAGNLILTFGGKVTPSALPKTKKAPISLTVNATIGTANGAQPPAATEVIVDTDKNGEVNAAGLPVCTASKLQAEDTKQAEAACPTAIVGKGSTKVLVTFPESPPFTAEGPLVLFNGGSKGGKTLLLIQAYVAVPTPTALVTTVEITKEHDGPYGTHSVAQIPVIAGGAGSVTDFSFTLHRLFTNKGHKESYLMAQCANGHFVAHATAKFSDGTDIEGNTVVPCKSKG